MVIDGIMTALVDIAGIDIQSGKNGMLNEIAGKGACRKGGLVVANS